MLASIHNDVKTGNAVDPLVLDFTGQSVAMTVPT